MISHASFQEQVIDELQGYANLVALVNIDEIREFQYQGTEFNYPAVRVDARTQIPEGAGNCRTKHSIENFAVVAFSEDASSLECERICFQIGEAMFGAQMEDAAPSQGPSWRTETVNLIQYNAPRWSNAENNWRGEVIFRCRVKKTS
jgi:hypothetical protein